MNEITNSIGAAERGGLIDLGKALRALLESGGGGLGGGTAATAADFRTGTSTTTFISPAAYFEAHASYTIMDAEPIIVNMSNGINFLLTLAGDRTIANPIGYKIGQEGVIVIQQNAIGGHSVTWGTSWKFIGSEPAIPVTPHAWTLLRYYVQATDVIRVTSEASGGTALNAATVADIHAGLESLKYISPATIIDAAAPVLLIDEPLILIDFGEGQTFTVTLSGNRTMDSPLDQMPGRSGNVIVKQDGIGGRTLAWHADWKFLGDSISIASEPNAVSVFRYYVESIGNVRLIPQSIAASVSDLWIGTSTDKYISPLTTYSGQSPVALEGGTIITPDFSTGLTFSLTLNGLWEIGNPINQKAGQSGLFYIAQGTAGDNTVTFGTNYQFIGGILPTVPQSPGGWTVIPYYVFSPGTILCSTVEATYQAGSGTTNIVPASVAEIRAGLVEAKYISPLGYVGAYAPVTLTDGATITPDMATSRNFVVTIAGNRTIANMTNQRVGLNGFFIFIQDATGGRTLTWGSNYSFIGGTPVLPTTPNSWYMIPYHIQALGTIRCLPPQTSVIPNASTVAEYRTGTATNSYISPAVAIGGGAPVDLVDGTTIPVNFSAGINFRVVIAGNRGVENPTNQAAGQEGKFIIYQDTAGGRSLTWGNNYRFETGAAPSLTATANSFTTIPYYVEAPGTILMGA